MAAGFDIKNDVLNRLAMDLGNVGSQTDEVMSSLDSYADGGDLGADDLNSACKSFHDSWKYGLGKLKSDMQDTAKDIAETAKQYDATEADVVRGLEKYRIA